MTFAQFVNSIITIGNTIVVPILFTLTAAVFLWGVLNYFIFHGDDEDARTKGRQFMIWGVLGLVVMFSVWGLINLLLSTLGITSGR